jgi:hypothetical protein
MLLLFRPDLVNRRLEGLANVAGRQILDHGGQARPVGSVLGLGQEHRVEHDQLEGHQIDGAAEQERRVEQGAAGLLGGPDGGADAAGVAAQLLDEALEGGDVAGGLVPEVPA